MLGGFELALWSLLAISSLTDLIWGKVYNWTTFAFFFAGLVCRFGLEGSGAGFESVQAIGMAMVLFLPLYILGVVAAGDVKLLMAFAAWTSPTVVVRMAVLGILVGAAVGLLTLIQARGFASGASSVFKHASGKAEESESFRMAFAPAFLVAYLVLDVAMYRHWNLWI
jgi:prepilin peptidase CpaA